MTSSAVRFGSGLYASSAQVREEAQGYFFKVLREVCPEALYSLRGDLFPLYLELAGRHPGTRGAGVPPQLQSFLELERQEPALAKRVVSWCAKFHLVGQVEVEPEWHGPELVRRRSSEQPLASPSNPRDACGPVASSGFALAECGPAAVAADKPLARSQRSSADAGCADCGAGRIQQRGSLSRAYDESLRTSVARNPGEPKRSCETGRVDPGFDQNTA
jgi:hypothetical protein